MGPKTHYKAFVSSTFEDLKNHRAHVIRQLRRAGFFVDPMEDWTAETNEPKQFSQNRLQGCDLCVLLVAFRRGCIPEGETCSITQLEYEAALKQEIDILPFLLDEDAPWWAKFDEREKDPSLVIWRSQLRQRHGSEKFTLDPQSIDLTGALGRWFAKNEGSPIDPGPLEKIDWPEGQSPYPGLEWFDEEYAPLFFGRDQEVANLIAKMSEPQGRFLIISGASGSGKSSLVAAGLWKALKVEDRLPQSTRWVWQRMTPGDGETPFVSLAWGLKQAFHRLTPRPDELAKQLAKNSNAFEAQLASQLQDNQELLLFLDQLEELFTRGFKDEDIQHFLAHLVTVAQDPRNRLRVVSTVRSEFIGKLEESAQVLRVLNAGYNYHLGPVSPRIIQEMIEKPAQVTGYDFEPRLVNAILDEAGKEPGNLPLVAYALKQLFERRDRDKRTFTYAAYDAIGGVTGAIGTKADEVLKTLGSEVGQPFDRVFAELVHLDRERPPTRKRVPLSIFQDDEGPIRLVQNLAGRDCRVLVTSGERNDSTVEVAHEKLFTAWPKLRRWIEDSSEALRLIDYAEEAATRWHETGRHLQELWLNRRAEDIRKGLDRFGKLPSPELERMLRPQHMLIERLGDATLSHEERLLIGKKLAEFGDPRKGVGLGEDGLPDLAWIDIPGGKIQLEQVDHLFAVKPFLMAKYPVTNAQFQAFIEDGGYENEEWWQGIRKVEPQPSSWQEPNAPRETVSWFEAMAFCNWLSARTGTRIRLPTEWEWQQAASGGNPAYDYPWGKDWDAARCNSYESRLNRTSAVGLYPKGVTLQGTMDMAGNVWEWCLNTYDNPEKPKPVRLDDSESQRVSRGGSWSDGPENLRPSVRYRDDAVLRLNFLGFRLTQDTP
ncbi:MAG: SUMF1/EgtB/PvdO family nonheme iron enzyme [Nitrospirales bacterium]|nr:SUMF1/EgtB/PvdO family nonheme iron enzyme [Nitrospirales bacterium]